MRGVPNFGPLEIGIVLLIVLVIFGPKRLPELGRSLGRGMREFKDSITGKDERRQELPDAERREQAAAGEREEAPTPAGERRP
jgi:sec-independent protein translocase protein TatA